MAKSSRPTRPRRSTAELLWQKAAAATCDPARAQRNFERFLAAHTNADALRKQLAAHPTALSHFATLFAASQSLSETLIQHPDYLDWLLEGDLKSPDAAPQLRSELSAAVSAAASESEKYAAIRRVKRRHQLRIGLRDLAGLGRVEETARELSDLADICLDAVYAVALESLTRKHGAPLQQSDGQPAAFTVLGMGKLGGQELNYSSDVDVIFVYSDDGHVKSPAGTHLSMTNEEFFARLAESIIAAVGAITADGSIYRIDLRLRPEGATGPLVRSLESCENYYAALGETWERLALLKARHVAGDEKLARDFLQMVTPFVFRRYGGEGVLRDIAVIKGRIERESVKAHQLTRHVKLGVGGIREIEFILQALQVLHGGRRAELRAANTLRGLELLGISGLLPPNDVRALADAYRFLRIVEHRLQMEADLQTHTIPDEAAALVRLTRLLGFDNVAAFERTQTALTSKVRLVYQNLLASAGLPSSPAEAAAAERAPTLFVVPPTDAEGEPSYDEAFMNALTHAGFREPKTAAKTFTTLAYGSGFTHVSAQTSEKFLKLVPKILSQSRALADPDLALQQFDRFVERYGSRSSLYDTFNANPQLVELLLKLFDHSRFLGETFLRWPDLFDDVVRGEALSQSKKIPMMLEELQRQLAGTPGDWESAAAVARRYQRAELVRIALADILGLADVEWTQAEMSFLAEAQLRFAFDACAREIQPPVPPLAVIALGKFGGQELGYGADLDVLFVTNDDAESAMSAARLANRLIEFMSKQTADGSIFKLDARLRPDGEQGPLVPSLTACRRYYGKRAWLWEKQSLLKARFVAGETKTGRAFMGLVNETVFSRPLTDDERQEILAMRRRIEQERSDRAQPELSFKTTAGGMMDVEFLVQTLQLRHGHEMESLRCAPTLAALGRLTARGLVEESDNYTLRHDYLFLRRVESALRRHENSPVSSLLPDETEQQKLAKRLGFSSREEFWKTYETVRRRIRNIYEKLMK